MFKKNLIAAAIMTCVAAPAFADVVITPNTDVSFLTTKVAAVTKQPVLDFSTAQQDLTVSFNEANDLRDNGFIVIEIKDQGNAEFNASEIRQWLSSDDVVSTDLATAVFAGIKVDTNSSDTTAASNLGLEVDKFFKTSYDGAKFVIEHTVDNNNKRLRIALKSELAADVKTINSQVQLLLSKANQAFKLQSGVDGSVKLAVGSLLNASYTADPVETKELFILGDLFNLSFTDSGKATAKVATGFKKLDSIDLVAGNVASTGFSLENLTTNQTIQLDKVKLTLDGDVSAFRTNTAGELLLADGTKSGWKAVSGNQSATAVAGSTNLSGTSTQLLSNLGKLSVAANNAVAIPAASYNVTAKIFGKDQATYNDFTDAVSKLFIITRDGLKFDTITTGTTSSNQIFIRDVSKVLPDVGGKIFVTITEYDQHSVNNGRGEGTDLVTRAELSTTLPSGGAVTLTPADVAADVGAKITDGRQARFLFEVETDRGEVAVKKAVGGGVDIQNGTRGTEPLVDFTL